MSSSESNIAADLAQNIAANVLAAEATDLLDPVLASLGLASDSDSAAQYYQQIMGQLTVIEGDLDRVLTKLGTLSVGITEIANELTAISSQLTDAELQSELAQYFQNANIINQNYQTYAAALGAMAGSATFKQGTDALFDLFQTLNTDAVATAMRNIHDLLVGSGELHGILSYQANEVQQAYAAFASVPANSTNIIVPNGGNNWAHCFPDGSMLLSALPSVLANAFSATVIPSLKAALAVQVKGLSFLCAAWGGTVYESNLATQVDDLEDVIAGMKTLFGAIDLDGMAGTILQTYGTRLSQDILNTTWALDNCARAGPPPFDQSWIFWNVPYYNEWKKPEPQAAMVQAPWRYGTVDCYPIANDEAFTVGTPGGWVVSNYCAEPVSSATIARPSAGVAQPDVYTNFLASLPAGGGARDLN